MSRLVVAAGLAVQHRGARAAVVAQRVREVARAVVDVDVLARRHQRRRAPALGRQVLRDRGREAARVREDRDRALQQRLVRVVAAERAADAHAVPRIGHAQAVAADHVDAGALRHRADLARVVHRDLLGDDDDLLQPRVDADQLGDAVAHARGRQVDHAGVERVAGVQALAHVVEHRDVADRRLQHLAAAPRRGAEDDVAAGERVAGRRHLARFAAQDVEHADAVAAGGQVGQRVDAQVVGKAGDALGIHGGAPQAPRGCRAAARPRAAAGLHPVVDLLGVVDDLGDRAVEAEEAVGHAERVAGVGQRAEAAHQVRPAAADHHVQRRRALGREVLAQRVAHRAQRLVDVGVVRLAADDEQHVRLLEEVAVADARHLLHLLVRRVAAEVRADARRLAQHLGHQAVGAAAEGRREDGAAAR